MSRISEISPRLRGDPGSAPTAPGQQSPLTRSNWRTWLHRKLHRNLARVDGVLTKKPMQTAVPPLRNTSASSTQSPPAKAEASSVII